MDRYFISWYPTVSARTREFFTGLFYFLFSFLLFVNYFPKLNSKIFNCPLRILIPIQFIDCPLCISLGNYICHSGNECSRLVAEVAGIRYYLIIDGCSSSIVALLFLLPTCYPPLTCTYAPYTKDNTMVDLRKQ